VLRTSPALYQEHAPHPALADYVQCYWSIAPSSLELINHVLPDGCIDIMFGFNDTTYSADVVGTMQAAVSVPIAPHETSLGVRFKPGGALPFLRLPMHEITDQTLELKNVWGKVGAYLAEQLHAAPTIPAKIARLEVELLQRVDCLPSVDSLTLDAVHCILTARGSVTVRELTAYTALSERQLERRFRQHTGLSPKLFARMMRFRRAAMLLQQQPQLPLQDLVFNSGFYDQAHFIHDFKAFAKLTPTEYQTRQNDVGFLQYSVRLP
jgi:AraC-like DNA-binding protein